MKCSTVEDLEAFRLTEAAILWGKQQAYRNRSDIDLNAIPQFLSEKAGFKVSSEFSGHFMTPKDISWNFNFMVRDHSNYMDYDLVIGDPLPYSHPIHQPRELLCFKDIHEDNAAFDKEDQKNKKKKRDKKKDKKRD